MFGNDYPPTNITEKTPLTVDCIMTREQIVYNADHHFIDTLSPICQPLIRAQREREREQGVQWVSIQQRCGQETLPKIIPLAYIYCIESSRNTE